MAEVIYTVLVAGVALLWADGPRQPSREARLPARPWPLALTVVGCGLVLAGAISSNGPAIGMVIASSCGMVGGLLAVAIASTAPGGPARAYLVVAVAVTLALVEILYAG